MSDTDTIKTDSTASNPVDIAELAEQIERQDNIEAVESRPGPHHDEVIVVFKPHYILHVDFLKQYGLALRDVWITVERYQYREYLFPQRRLVARFVCREVETA